MKTQVISAQEFKGNLIYPKKITPKLQEFKQYLGSCFSRIIKDEPFDFFVYESDVKGSKQIGLSIKPTNIIKSPGNNAQIVIGNFLRLSETVKDFAINVETKGLIKKPFREITKENFKKIVNHPMMQVPQIYTKSKSKLK